MKSTLKPLDIVKTPKGAIAIVTDVNDNEIAIHFIGEQTTHEQTAWWEQKELIKIDNLAGILCELIGDPMDMDMSCDTLGQKNRKFYD